MLNISALCVEQLVSINQILSAMHWRLLSRECFAGQDTSRLAPLLPSRNTAGSAIAEVLLFSDLLDVEASGERAVRFIVGAVGSMGLVKQRRERRKGAGRKGHDLVRSQCRRRWYEELTPTLCTYRYQSLCSRCVVRGACSAARSRQRRCARRPMQLVTRLVSGAPSSDVSRSCLTCLSSLPEWSVHRSTSPLDN